MAIQRNQVHEWMEVYELLRSILQQTVNHHSVYFVTLFHSKR